MATYYISGTGNDRNSGITQTQAFRTFEQVQQVLKAGDTVLVMNGTYTNAYPQSNILTIQNLHATAAQPTTVKAYPGHTPVLEAHRNNWNAVNIQGSSHVVIEGLTLRGARDEITLNYALEQKNNLQNPATSGNGIYVNYLNGASGTPADRIHSSHITIRNNRVTNFPGGGIGATQADYVTIANNIVSGNCFYSPYGTQGISNHHPWNSDNNTIDYKWIVSGNRVFDNEQKVPWYQAGEITEGHGIIMDTASNRDTDISPYTGRVLIANNTIYNNGGAGINVYQGKNPVDVVHNTVYQNARILTQIGEVAFHEVSNGRAYNNILYARSGGKANSISGTNVVFDRNLAYNGSFTASDRSNAAGTNLININPQFVDPARSNFALKLGSAAIDAGSSLFDAVITADSLGISHRNGDNISDRRPDLGAYEYVIGATNELTAKARSPIQFIQGKPGLHRKGSDGKDTIAGSSNRDYLQGLGQTDRLSGGRSSDKLNGDSGNDLLTGGADNDRLDGGTGNDRLQGESGQDYLLGGADTDHLIGGGGADILVGGTGRDRLQGGNGKDLFCFNSLADAGDQILDFQAVDVIDLRPIFAQSSRQQSYSRYVEFLRFEQSGANTIVMIDADVQGKGTRFTPLVTLQNTAIDRMSALNWVL